MRHKIKLIESVIILMAFFFLSGCDSPDSDDDNSGGAPFEIDDIKVGGSGCSDEETFKVELNSNDEGDTITVELSDFSATTDDEHRYKFSGCAIAINIKVPAGLSVGLAGIDHEGGAYIPSGGEGNLHWEQFFTGGQGPKVDSKITTYDEYHEFSYKSTDPVLWSECGDSVIARSNSSIYVEKNENSSVEAQEHASNIKFHLKWKECERTVKE